MNRPKKIPEKSGVYIFKNSRGGVLYVGRAVNLNRRVSQYFRKQKDMRINEMIALAKSIEMKVTDNLLDAIILEANLIKKYWPKYNIKDKDNRSFLYIVIPRGDFPCPFIIRERELRKIPRGKARIFGPYQSVSLLKNALKIVRRIFPYSTCKPTGKPCFDRQIGLCPGLCTGEISKKDYARNIKNIVLLLSGEKKRLLEKLKKDNLRAVKALKHLQDVSLVTREGDNASSVERIEGYDISHLSGKEVYGSMVVSLDGRMDRSQYRLFKVKSVGNDDVHALEEVISRRLNHEEWQLPELILIDGGKPQIDHLSKVFDNLRIYIPIVGISKFSGDALVFGVKTNKATKDLIFSMKKDLLRVRDEAHRFCRQASLRARRRRI